MTQVPNSLRRKYHYKNLKILDHPKDKVQLLTCKRYIFPLYWGNWTSFHKNGDQISNQRIDIKPATILVDDQVDPMYNQAWI